ncbi:putative transcriptional regulator [Saccharopolyspora lacisalsi]|uniref:Putative transcriptional regulator n=1 Tax=Halosaccharopolyspora lacisalsi TaxID=1000566 RepID=A0A839DRC1_9PSEU|nr:BlaI/MecI/CopY family transcriptional regulator [Halosaccharopolyspora lacisalsi]MBA8824064.1 putative transcriptional regulator [Halosaccharopolyspora lacisalsi]
MRLGDLERAIMEVLWHHPDGLLAREVADRLPSSPAATTVLTVLDRLTRKQLVTRTKQGRAHRYAPMASKEAFLATAMHTALVEADDPDAVLSHFVGSVSEEETALLRRALTQVDRDHSEGPEVGES